MSETMIVEIRVAAHRELSRLRKTGWWFLVVAPIYLVAATARSVGPLWAFVDGLIAGAFWSWALDQAIEQGTPKRHRVEK